jgi:tetratricopeptide (TPR) repeat protein
MNDLELIDHYFSGTMPRSDRALFEERCERDAAFANEVAFYIASRQQLREALHEQKKKEFAIEYQRLSSKENTVRPITSTRWLYVAAAACIALVIVFFTVFRPQDPSRIASSYIKENLTTLSTTMSSGEDSLQLGIARYNEGRYQDAKTIFNSLAKRGNLAAESTRYLGITHLKLEEYDEAIVQFNKLSTHTQLYANPAKFYTAITLMKRAQGNDIEEAKKLLQEVVNEKLSGYREAELWLDKL